MLPWMQPATPPPRPPAVLFRITALWMVMWPELTTKIPPPPRSSRAAQVLSVIRITVPAGAITPSPSMRMPPPSWAWAVLWVTAPPAPMRSQLPLASTTSPSMSIS